MGDFVLAGAFLLTTIALIPSDGATGLAVAYLAGYLATDAYLLVPLSRRMRLEVAKRDGESVTLPIVTAGYRDGLAGCAAERRSQ